MPLRFVLPTKLAGRALPFHHTARYHGGQESGSHLRSICHTLSRCRIIRPVTVANRSSPPPSHTFCTSPVSPLPVRVTSIQITRLHSVRRRSLKLATTPIPWPPHLRPFSSCQAQSLGSQAVSLEMAVPKEEDAAPVDNLKGSADRDARSIGPSEDVSIDPESDDNVPVEAEELREALTRPPPVNSSYLPLPWKGRLGYACLNTYLRYSNPPVFCSRTCRIASILENRHPLSDPSQPLHPTKNRPDRSQPPDVAHGQAFVESLGLANARDVVKILRWNDRYGIKFMRLSSEMFPFASHKEYGYKLAPFAAEALGDAGRVIAELGHRVSVHPGQFTQLGTPREDVVESSIRDLEYHSEMLQLLRLPPQQDRDAVMILHMGGVFGDKEATLDRFRQNYQGLSQDIKNRLVLENDDVSWSVHDLLPICEELNIPLVLDFHHHNIIFDSTQLRGGTLDIMQLFDRIKATWTRKNITQKMHYSEPTSSAITNRERRKHRDRVTALPPCDPTMDLMIEAKDKEQAVLELMRIYKLPGHGLSNDLIPYVRTDENKPYKPPRQSKKEGAFVDLDGLVPPLKTVPDEEIGMGGPDGRVYWPPGMEEWLRPKKVIQTKAAQSPAKPRASKKTNGNAVEPAQQSGEADNGSTLATPDSKKPARAPRTSSAKKSTTRKRKASAEPTPSSASEEEVPPETPKLSRSRTTSNRRSTRVKQVNYAEDSGSALKRSILAPKPPARNRWRLPLPTPSSIRRSLPGRPFPLPTNSLDQPRRNRQGKFALFLRVLFGPHASRRAQSRLWGFRYETIPALRQRAQARVYRAIVNRQAKLAQRRAPGRRGIVGLLTATRSRLRGTELQSPSSRLGQVNNPRSGSGGVVPSVDRRRNNTLKRGAPMSQYLPSSSSAPGGRRKKVFEYLKAANELRQSYAAQWTQQRNGLRDYDEDYFNTPGAFPDVEIARSGDEEMVIFPSYARRLVKGLHHSRDHSRRRRDSTSTIDEYRGGSEEGERGLADWEVIEDENAIVAVDVRGWVYAPHRGPMTRKHRLMIALARKLSGVPAPNNPSNEAEEPNTAAAMGTHGGREDEIVDTEAQSIIRKAEGRTDTGLDDGTLPGRPLQKTSTSTSLESTPMNKDELSVANAHLMERLRPFLTNPVTQMPVTVFFFNDGKSQSRSIMTDESGHFMLRAALPFVPTHVRVLASEELSAVKEVQIIEPAGVSLISDVDDTIKHSAIASGAKEIFRNTFVRELAGLTIHGVADWYNKLAKMGVEVHYVSNAPWQLYPLLDRYFKLVGLPPGSVHLKQYSGMLQGIFEPTAERKRGPLEQILRDFPERKFILVGDSGEADLEVYTDIALANPGRILGVFIRDITTPDRKRFFEKSVEHLDNAVSRSRSTPHLHDDSDAIARRPTLPPRRAQGSPDSSSDAKQLDNADLIDLRDEDELRNPSDEALKPPTARTPPAKPSKPSSLRTVATTSELENGSSTSLSQDAIKRKPVPPLPARRNPQAGQGLSETSSTTSLPTRPKPSSDNSSFVSQDTNDQRPSRTKQAPPPPPPRRSNTGATTTAPSIDSTRTSSPRPPPPPQKPPQSYPAAAATAASTALQYASDRLPWAPSPSNLLQTTTSNSNLRNSSDSQDSDSQSGLAYPSSAVGPLPSRREETWRRRWERAHELLADHGVVLGSWREGKDVQDVSIWLVEEALKEAKRNAGGGGPRA
ncbi:uncharacterized protein KD926_002303 [Aspergillus affinis]|uniref:uncharacterized protein n=1 Tax=Aspergillus affinis TaxID=1070780 RepID=UPI0022FE1636|nr:uncharacterized protein KD926_002303 [Aspergillus affinis]KAI9043924.1 hypothetical protein KD926_002303 [Aspergillus affinis]